VEIMIGYSDTIRRWATDTRRAGTLQDADGTGEIGLDTQEPGSRLAVRFTLKVERNRLTDVRYQVFGCGFSMAACAMAADLSIGCTLDDVQAIDAKRLDAALKGIPAEREYCAQLAVLALHAAIKSARNNRRPVQASMPQEAEHEARVTAADPVYAALVSSRKPDRVTDEDRHLFACLFAVVAQEPYETAAALGLDEGDLVAILETYFPGVDHSICVKSSETTETLPPLRNSEVLAILLSHVAVEADNRNLHRSVWLAHILAARAALPGHLWIAMGLFERPQLTAAIRRYLPSLAVANQQNMRWKRYLYKQVCDRNGGVMCKAPNCGVCSDYALCFAVEE
jgi:nitrogen fixation protein NifQ